MDTKTPLTRGNEPTPTTLRLIRATGHITLISSLALLVILAVFRPDPFARIWPVIAAHVVSGHPGNALVGLKLGFSHGFLLFQTCLQDIIMVCLIFPWLVTGFKHVAHVPYVGSSLANMHDFAMRHHKRIKPYGVIGLMVFVFIPILSTGPIVGTFIGYLIGMSTLANFTVIFVANTLCAFTWVYAYGWLDEKYAEVTWVLLGVLVAAILGGMIFRFVKTRLQARRKVLLEARRKLKDERLAARRAPAPNNAAVTGKPE